MAFRQRAPTFRPQLSARRVYETFQPRSEIKDLPEAYVLHVYLPGFPKDSVKITYVASSRTARITGETQIQGTRWYRFDQSYPIPDYCEPESLQGKFETPVLTLTMPKKATSQAPPKQQEAETSQEKGVPEPKPDEKLQDNSTLPQSTTTTKVEEPIQGKTSAAPQLTTTLEDAPSQTPSEPLKNRKGQEETVERVGPSGEPQMGEKELDSKPTPTRVATMQRDEKIQKGQEEVESRPTPTMPTKMETVTDEKPQKGQEEFDPRPPPAMLTKVKTAEKYQNSQGEFEPRPTPAMLTKVKTAEKSQKGQEEFEHKATPTMAPNIKTDEQTPKGLEGDEPKPVTNVTRKPTVKEQLEEKKTQETSDRDEEKERFTNKEAKEEPSKSRKSVKDKEQADFGEKETKTEKLLAKEAETSAPKIQKKKEKQSSNRTSLKKELKSEENALERVGSVSQVFKKFAEGILDEEEKILAANVGAAVLVLAALGYCVSYKFVS